MAELILPRRDFYVYVIFRPNGIPCYVGKGCRGRWQQHAKHTHNKLLKILYKESGRDLPVIKIRNHLTNNEACDIEISLIKAIGRGLNGPLFNMTDGGEGTLGWCPSSETKTKMNAKKRGVPLTPEHRAKLSLSGRGKPKSAAHIEKMRERVLGEKNPMFGKRWKQTEEECLRKSLALKGRPPSQKCIDSALIAMAGFRHSEESKRKMSVSHLGKPKSPEHARKIGDALRGVKRGPLTPEALALRRQKISEKKATKTR